MNIKAWTGLFISILVIAAGIGWVLNIVKLVGCDFEAPYKCEVVHTIGIVPLVGSITGYLDVGK